MTNEHVLDVLFFFFLFFFLLTSIHPLKKNKQTKKKHLGGRVRVKRGGGGDTGDRMLEKTFAWSRNNEQVSSGKRSVLQEGGGSPQMSSPKNLSSTTRTSSSCGRWFVCGRLQSLFQHIFPRCVPGSLNIVKAVILLSNVALYKHQIQPPSRFTHH